MQKKILMLAFMLFASVLAPSSAQGVTLTGDISAEINVRFDSLMHASYSIDGYIFSARAFGINADAFTISEILRDDGVRKSVEAMVREEFMKMKDSAFPYMNLTLDSVYFDYAEIAMVGGREAMRLRLKGGMSITPEDVGYKIDMERIFNGYDPVSIVSSMISGAEGMKGSATPKRVQQVSDEEIYSGAMDAGAYADMNFSLASMQRIGARYTCRIALPEHVMLENTNVRQTREGDRHVIEFDEKTDAIRGRIVSDRAPRYDSDDVIVEGYASIDESAVMIDLPAFFRSLWLEDAARGHVSARTSITVDHFRAPEGLMAIMPQGTGMDYVDADAIRFGYRIGMLTDEDLTEMFGVIVPAIEAMYQNLFSGFGSSKVILSVDVQGFIEQLKSNETGPLRIEAVGYLDVPLIAFIRGSGTGGGSAQITPGMVRIARSLIGLARTRVVPLSFSLRNPLKYWPLDFHITFGEGLEANGGKELYISVPPGESARQDIRIWFSFPFVISLARPYAAVVYILALMALALLALLYFVLEWLTRTFKYHLR